MHALEIQYTPLDYTPDNLAASVELLEVHRNRIYQKQHSDEKAK